MERFFSIEHLTAEQLHDLYRDAVGVGKLHIEYDNPGEYGHKELTLPEEEILRNIAVESRNYIVFNENNVVHEFPDSTSVVFPLAEHPFTTAYIDIDNSMLDWFAEKYGLAEWWEWDNNEIKRIYPFAEFYTHEPMKRRDIN